MQIAFSKQIFTLAGFKERWSYIKDADEGSQSSRSWIFYVLYCRQLDLWRSFTSHPRGFLSSVLLLQFGSTELRGLLDERWNVFEELIQVQLPTIQDYKYRRRLLQCLEVKLYSYIVLIKSPHNYRWTIESHKCSWHHHPTKSTKKCGQMPSSALGESCT